MARESIAARVRKYIDARPVVRDALAMDIVNLSALSRRIMDDTGIESEEAVLVACRRYEAAPLDASYEAAIRRVLTRSSLEVRTNAALVTARRSWQIFAQLERTMNKLRGRSHPIHIIQGSESLTFITDETVLGEVLEVLDESDLIQTRTDLVELNLRSPDVVEDVPGILAFLSTTLSSRGINFLEVISCYKDNMFLIEKDDLFTAFELLNQLTGDDGS